MSGPDERSGAATGRRTAVVHGGVTEARSAAAEVCADLRSGELLDGSFERRGAHLESRDRRWLHELLFGMLRRRAWLDAVLGDRVRGGLVRLDADLTDLLRLGAYQLLFMRSVPAYAAIAQTVELTKRRHGLGASKLVNAVLRRLDREHDALALDPGASSLPAQATTTPLTDPIDELALAHSHPRWLVARWTARWGERETARLLESNNTEAPIFIRPWGIVREQLEATLESAGVHVTEGALLGDSMRLAAPTSLADVAAFRDGLFFVQDPGATLVSRYAAIPDDAIVADLCAAPGGKALELARTARLVVAADRSPARLRRLLENIARLDAANVVAMVADARLPALREVDAVLLDVPCTGTGTFRRHPDARWRLRVSDLAVMGAVQRQMLRAAMALVRPGGLLVYSTCSLEPEENDSQVESFLQDFPDWKLEPPPAGAVPDGVLDAGRLRVLPHRHGVDGAFAARLRRSGGGGGS
jgi:16S rRNA (cytosine967-C5)-methyltransferase